MEQCTISGTLLNNQCDSVKDIYPTQVTLLLTDILLFSVFFGKMYFLELPAKFYSRNFAALVS